jgi:NADH-quinone oxidoreductase subunit I
MCATVCPAKVIEIEAGFNPDDAAHPKYPIRFEIDYSRCVFCGLCVEACPEDAIRMTEDVPNLPGKDRGRMWLSLPELLTWNPQQDVAKPYPPAPSSPLSSPSSPRTRGPSDVTASTLHSLRPSGVIGGGNAQTNVESLQ